MLKNYFADLNKKIVKKAAASKTSASSKTAKDKSAVKKGAVQAIDVNLLVEKLNGIIPANLRIGQLKPVDSSGFSPDGSDFVAYREYCRDIDKLLNGYVPFELIHGAFFFVKEVSKSSLADVFGRVASVKKINHFNEESEVFSIPSFIIVNENSDYSMSEIKNDVVNYYMSKNISSDSEFEIMMVNNRGLLIKDWHNGKHKYVGLETNEDTLMWFCILINEYLEVERKDIFDLRSYIRSEKSYSEI